MPHNRPSQACVVLCGLGVLGCLTMQLHLPRLHARSIAISTKCSQCNGVYHAFVLDDTHAANSNLQEGLQQDVHMYSMMVAYLLDNGE